MKFIENLHKNNKGKNKIHVKEVGRINQWVVYH
jgi:hypothetical protein